MTNKYTILSIGPIYDTLLQADNTRAIWTVSFMFSYLMRETIRDLVDVKKIDEKKFLVPNYTEAFRENYMNDGESIGIFHDRLILKGEFAEQVNEAFHKALDGLANIVGETFSISTKYDTVKVDADENKVQAFIKGYFQSYVAQVDIKTGKNPILELSTFVDAIEYEPKLAPHEEKEYLFLFLRLTNLSLLQEAGFGKESAYNVLKDRCFKSLPEIATHELLCRFEQEDPEAFEEYKKEYLCLTVKRLEQLKEKDEEDTIYDELARRYPDTLKPYHKYVAIVHGDGDSFGKFLESIGSNEAAIRDFSDAIFGFLIEARDIIKDYGGYQLVGSGEDLLFFAPVISENKHIFSLVDALDEAFSKHFARLEQYNEKNDFKLSMSYGISVTYYKFPLQEALDLSKDALWYHAKEATFASADNKKKATKNAVHILTRKHSGQSQALTLHKGTDLYKAFVRLIDQELARDSDLWLPHSLHHSLMQVDTLIDTMDIDNIEPFFANMFNEKVHKTKHDAALRALQSILRSLKDPDSNDPIHLRQSDGTIPSASETIFAMLSIIKILRGDK